jgi:hypothetical protein
MQLYEYVWLSSALLWLDVMEKFYSITGLELNVTAIEASLSLIGSDF